MHKIKIVLSRFGRQVENRLAQGITTSPSPTHSIPYFRHLQLLALKCEIYCVLDKLLGEFSKQLTGKIEKIELWTSCC